MTLNRIPAEAASHKPPAPQTRKPPRRGTRAAPPAHTVPDASVSHVCDGPARSCDVTRGGTPEPRTGHRVSFWEGIIFQPCISINCNGNH